MARVTIDFYRAEIKPTTSHQTIESAFEALLEKEVISLDEASHTWELRNLERINEGRGFRGAMTKLRHTGLPTKAKRGGEEESLGLAEDEGLVEKAFFSYFSHRRLLLWQANKMCGSPVKLRAILRDVLGADVSFNTVAQAGAVERLLDGKGVMKNFDITLARPTNSDIFPNDNFTSGLLGLLSEAGGDRMVVGVRTDGRLKAGTPINEKLRRVFSLITERDEVEAARIDLADDDGNIEPVDLVADRIRAYQDVTLNGKYPDARAVYAAIDISLEQKAAELAVIFGA